LECDVKLAELLHPSERQKKNCNKNDKEGKILLLAPHSEGFPSFSQPFFLVQQ
jgi:hypothetical protein